ncbi:sensor histidine kinase [Adhaeretor mobilis]|uniref:histidine kinase n=1 Tax=Adhaeretor mobilis TaxID=1930276 RepID=A0A517MZL8_9BACT|nr:ATP-binding protein [Adhaeretor mobilis]QDT00329.1 Sensor histidine kinase TmoS [Adhaeretor mobilis]
MSNGDQANQVTALQQQLAAMQQELVETQRLAALGELVGTTTHEFNNVLMTVLNYAKLGLRHKDDATREKSLTKILAAAQRAEKICNSVLGMARNRKEEFAPTMLQQLVEESLVLLEREMQKYRIAVQTDFSETPAVRAIGNQIQQVLLNLMTNARQAMSDGGTLLIKIAYHKSANLVDLTVQDSGSGIPKEQLAKIFERGFSTKDGPDETGKGGAGVGLAACRDIIEKHQGRVRVESTVGKGTAFTVRLPVFVQPQAAAGAPIVTQLGVPSMGAVVNGQG